MREFVAAGQPFRLQNFGFEICCRGRIRRGPFGLHRRDHTAGDQRPLGTAGRNAVHTHSERVRDSGAEKSLHDRPLHDRAVEIARVAERAPLRCLPRLGSRCRKNLPRQRDPAAHPDRWNFESGGQLDRNARQSDARSGPRQIVADRDPPEQRSHFGRLAVGVAELALGCALLFALGDDGGAVLSFLVAVLGAESACPLRCELSSVISRRRRARTDFIEPLSNFRQPDRQAFARWSFRELR